jgi:hypothetical protein
MLISDEPDVVAIGWEGLYVVLAKVVRTAGEYDCTTIYPKSESKLDFYA